METVLETIMKERGMARLSGTEANLLSKECMERALVQLMKEKKYEDISITEIVKRSGVSRSSFYRSYASKEAIIESIRQRISAQVKEQFFSMEVLRDVRILFANLFEFIRDNSKDIEILIEISHWSHIMLLPKITNYYRMENTEEMYQAEMCEGALNALMSVWLKNGMKETPEYMADLAYDMFGQKYQGLLKNPV